MVNQPLIRTKLLRIENNLKRIDEFNKLSITIFKKDLNAQDIVLYNLQLAIQGCLDIASHIISDQGWNAPASLAGMFDTLSAKKVISAKLAADLAAMARFRNVLVHEYDVIDLNKVYLIYTKNIKDIRLFLKTIIKYAKL